jgi:two-component system sensor histidine kinase KdpD
LDLGKGSRRLASIKASAGSLLQSGVEWSESDRRSFLTTIDRESDRLNRLVGNLLEMSRIEGETEWYDLGELAREVIARLQASLGGRQVHLDVPEGLPPIEIDYLMIDQVLTNLIENSAKYTSLDTPIAVRIQAEPGVLRICVVDRGPGIPPEERGPVFHKFYRLSPRGKASGSGLGLAVAKGLVEAHHGRIWIDETPGGGATVCFELPA